MALTRDEVIATNGISYEQAIEYILIDDPGKIQTIVNLAGGVARHMHGKRTDLCEIINAKSGLCAEDCAFCAQSVRHASGVDRFPLVKTQTVLTRAELAQSRGAKEFCIVTSGGRLTESELKQLIETVQILCEKLKIHIDVSVGFLNAPQARRLKEAGVRRVNHNLQTSPHFYPQIVTTHTYADRKQTLRAIREAGLEVCCGVILGLGESREERIQAVFEIKKYEPECVPLNLLDPRPGTPLEGCDLMDPLEILKTIAVYRLIIPKTCLKLAGGRHLQLKYHQKEAFEAGINGLIVGEYLTTKNDCLNDDLQRIREAGLEWE